MKKFMSYIIALLIGSVIGLSIVFLLINHSNDSNFEEFCEIIDTENVEFIKKRGFSEDFFAYEFFVKGHTIAVSVFKPKASDDNYIIWIHTKDGIKEGMMAEFSFWTGSDITLNEGVSVFSKLISRSKIK